MQLDALLNHIPSAARIPPLETWHPPCLGDMNLTIASNGCWWHEGAPFTNARVQRLLAALLRREDDGAHYLVVPSEKWRIRVEDTALLIVDTECTAGRWILRTNMGDDVALEGDTRLHSAQGEAVAPYVPVRFGLTARLNRNVFYRLVEQAEARDMGEDIELGIVSDGVWQPLGRMPGEQA